MEENQTVKSLTGNKKCEPDAPNFVFCPLMDWKQFWDNKAAQLQPLEQVGRNGITVERMNVLMQEQAQRAAELLQVHPQAHVLDVCCGNGIFSRYVLPHVGKLVGVDLSSELIHKAQALHTHQAVFEVADVLHLKQWSAYTNYLQQFDAIMLCFSFQYFDTYEKGKQVIEHLLPLLKPSGKILLTDIPDRARFFQHYNTLPKLAGLIVQMAKGKNVMGKFWAEDEMKLICKQLEVQGEFLHQPKHYAYAHYRFDYLITKP
jgi:ubiquinone/menaquinone biosynthesis C-methylase UbiE